MILFTTILIIAVVAGVILAFFFPVLTGATSLVAIVALEISAESAGSGALAFIFPLGAAYIVFFASVVAFFAQLVQRKRNQKT